MDPLFIWLETTSWSIWIRESPSVLAFPAILALHTLGLACLVGPSVAIALHILGAAPGLRSAALLRLSPVMWAGFWLNALSGAALLLAYPAKALTNPLFFVKLALVGSGVVVVRILLARLSHRTSTEWGLATRRLAMGSLALWMTTIFAGRLLAYTYNRLLAYAGL